jgi:hypothetical protein
MRLSPATVVVFASLVIGAAIVLAWSFGPGKPGQPQSGSTATPRPAPEAPDAPAIPMNGAATIVLRIRVTPTWARITLDDQTLAGSTFTGNYPKGAFPHELVVSADGYETVTQVLDFDHDLTVNIALQPLQTAGSVAP